MYSVLARHPVPVRSIWRRVHQRANPLVFQTLHVNEFPKSGGTWLCRMLSECLAWRFDDNTYPWFGSAVVKHHRLGLSARCQIAVIRDPRDVVVSYYHHCRQAYAGDGFNRHVVAMMARQFPESGGSEDARRDAFITAMIKTPIVPRYTWGQFYDQMSPHTRLIVRYEDLRADPITVLANIFENMQLEVPRSRIASVVATHDITRILRERGAASGVHFVRKGLVGGWRDVLSRHQVRLIEQDAGPLLGRFGYA